MYTYSEAGHAGRPAAIRGSSDGAKPGKGQIGSALNGVAANFVFFDRGTFWVLQSARAHLFHQSDNIPYFCSGPISVDPICRQSKHAPTSMRAGE